MTTDHESRAQQHRLSNDPARPNIVLIMTDQQRADFCRADGYPLDTTPFLDEFSRRGTRFRNAYTPMPVCAPARCSMLSGRYARATRVRDNGGIAQAVKAGDLVQSLREIGYSLHLAGKNHSFLGPEHVDSWSEYNHRHGPKRRRPEQEDAFEHWLRDIQFRPQTQPTPFPVEVQMAHRVVDDAIACIDGLDDRPFFLWLSLCEPHNPYQVPEPYFSLFPEADIPDRFGGPEVCAERGGHWLWMSRLLERKQPGHDATWRRYRADYLGMLRMVDDQIRRFVAHLEATGAYENTLFVFCSDHGDFAGDYGLQRKGVGLPECLVRIPLFFVGPGIQSGQVLAESFASLVDVMPTICDLANAPLPVGVQGNNLAPLLRGDLADGGAFTSAFAELGVGGLAYGADDCPDLGFGYDEERFNELNVVTQSGTLKMVRHGRWKLLVDATHRIELYDVAADPGERTNLADDPSMAAVSAQLQGELLRWLMATDDVLPIGDLAPRISPGAPVSDLIERRSTAPPGSLQ